MKRSQRMQTVRRLAERKTHQAEQALGQAQQALLAERQKLEQLESFRNEYQQNLLQQGRQGIRAEQLLRTQQFLARLGTAMEQQQRQIARAEQQLENAKQQWRAVRAREQVLESLVGRLQAEELQQEEKRLQKAVDELAQRRRDGW